MLMEILEAVTGFWHAQKNLAILTDPVCLRRTLVALVLEDSGSVAAKETEFSGIGVLAIVETGDKTAWG